MKNLLAILAVASTLTSGTALAADSSTVAGDDESDREVIDRIETKVNALTESLTALTNSVANFAARGQQIAVVETVPRSLQVSLPTRANNVEFYLVGHSTIPGFPVETVAANGRFGSYSVALPIGTYLFQLQQPYSDKVICQGNVSRLSGIGGGFGRGDCPRLFMIASDGSTLPRKRFDDGFGVYTVTSSSGGLSLRYNFPADLTFTNTGDRPLTSYKGAVKITKLK